MRVPGSNILNAAFRAIARQEFYYRPYLARELQVNGQELSAYGNPQLLSGSAQPPSRELFERYGLQFQGSYMVFYVSKSMIDVTRNTAGDQIDFNGKVWNVLSKTDWHGIDGWIGLISQEVPGPSAC